MKSIEFDRLAYMSQDEIEELSGSTKEFMIVADGAKKNAIIAFLNNEEKYRRGKRRLLHRILYLWGGRHAFSIMPFVTVWNKALINGLEIKSKEKVNSKLYLCFQMKEEE